MTANNVQHVQVLSYTESNLNYTECWISYLIALLKLARVKRGVDRRREKLLPVMLCIPPSAAQHMSREQEREWDLSENEDKRQCERLRLQAVRMKRKRGSNKIFYQPWIVSSNDDMQLGSGLQRSAIHSSSSVPAWVVKESLYRLQAHVCTEAMWKCCRTGTTTNYLLYKMLGCMTDKQ